LFGGKQKESSRKRFVVLTLSKNSHISKNFLRRTTTEKGTPEETCCPFSYHSSSSSSSGLLFHENKRVVVSLSLLFSSLLFSSRGSLTRRKNRKTVQKSRGKGNDEELYETYFVHGDPE